MKHIIRLFKMAKPWRVYLIWTTITLLFVTAINLATPRIAGQIIAIIEDGVLPDAMNVVFWLAMLQLGLFALRAVFQFLTSYLPHVASWNLVALLRNKLYEHYQKLSMDYYHDKQTGHLMSRVVGDAATSENLIAHAIPDLIINIITMIGVFSILLWINPTLTLLISIPIPFLALTTILIRRMKRYFQLGQEKNAEMNAILQDNFSGMKEIQVFNKQEYEFDRVSKTTIEHSSALIRALFFVGILRPMVEFITSLGAIIILIAGTMMALSGNFRISEMVEFLLYLGMFYMPLTHLTRLVEDVQTALAGAERVFEVLDTEPSIRNKPDAADIGRASGQISFNNVSFSYKDDLPVLENISFDVKPGEMVALVGPTGVGKTTISALVTRFYEPNSGSITMEGVDLRDMTLESLRNQLSLVLQDVFLFNGTISENIAYGSAGVKRTEIAEAAKTACIADYIESLPDGYDTVIGERGVRLSGGQKQRLAIARSILRNSPFLILDEATSSVDVETEREIQQAINSIAGTRTLIVIAHRLSTIRNADKIILLEDGKIAEQGKHEELLTQNGAYAKLHKLQNIV